MNKMAEVRSSLSTLVDNTIKGENGKQAKVVDLEYKLAEFEIQRRIRSLLMLS